MNWYTQMNSKFGNLIKRASHLSKRKAALKQINQHIPLSILPLIFCMPFLCGQDTQHPAEENLCTLVESEEPPLIAKTYFPVRLTPEEEAEEDSLYFSDPSCCASETSCTPTCCPPPSINCPPILPRCDPCDCIIDYFNPIVFNGFDLSVEWLYWTVQQKSSTYAISPNGNHQASPSVLTADALGKYKSASFDWNSGVRASLAHTFERDAWNLLAQYTYYKTSGSDSTERPRAPTLYLESPNRAIALSNNGINRLESSTHFQYQVADFLLSRRFLPGCQILLNCFAGPTGAWITEKWSIQALDSGTDPHALTKIQNSWHFKGAGMKGGLDANWHLGKGFALFNKFSVATLVGAYSNSKKTQVTATGASSAIINALVLPDICNTTEDETWVVPTSQIEFGLNWNHRFCNWAIALQGAFEINTWYDLHQYHQDGFTTSIATQDKLDYRNSSPVSLWGASAKAVFSF